MATFHPEPLSDESHSQQLQRYYQQRPLINNVEEIIQTQTEEYKKIAEQSSQEQVQAMQESTEAVCGTMDRGFELVSDNLRDLSYGLCDIKSEISGMSSMLGWNFSLLIEQQRISSILLGNVVEILKIPDIQKERQYYIEQGLKFLQNALLDDDFFEDALQNFLKSESIEPRDYFVLQRIGLIYYHSSKHKDLKSAEEYFLKAGKYAVASMKITEMGSPNLLQNHLDQKYYHRIDAAESYMFAGRSCYLQCKYSEAAEYSGKAFSLNPDLVEAGFTQAKSLAASNNELQAAGVLEKVIELDRFYSIRTLSDRDLCNKPPIHSLLKRLRIEATKKASDFVGDCKKKMIPDSMALKFLLQMEKLIEQNSFLTSKEVLDHCNKVQEYRFCEPFKNPTQTTKLNEIIKSIKSLSKLHYKGKNGNYIQVNEDFLDLILHEINDKTQWIFPLSQSIIKDSLNWQTQIITKTINCKIVQFIESENDYNDDLQNIVNQIYSISQKTSTEYNQWLEFSENERRKAIYAGRIADKEQHNRGILLGVIVGGVCAFIGYQSGGIGPSIITGIITFLLAYAYSRRK